mgnify:CR=1 FL=1|jgi:hypothetical protein
MYGERQYEQVEDEREEVEEVSVEVMHGFSVQYLLVVEFVTNIIVDVGHAV